MRDQILSLNQYKTVISFLMLFSFLLWETYAPFFKQFVSLKERGFHAAKNFTLQLLNVLVVAFIFTSLWSFSATKSASLGFGLLHQFEQNYFLELGLAILFFDFWTYWWHRMSHRVSFLWRFHRVHHSDSKMDVTSANRFHFGEIIISSVLRIIVIFVVGAEFFHLAIYEAIMFPIVQFHHANIALPRKVDSFLSYFIPTPGMHKVHHSRYRPETDSNYSSLLSIWDRIFGSFCFRADLENIKFGLSSFDDLDRQTLIGIIRTPLGK